MSITIEAVGSLQREVVVYLSTSDQTAYGNFCTDLLPGWMVGVQHFVSTADINNEGWSNQPLIFFTYSTLLSQ